MKAHLPLALIVAGCLTACGTFNQFTKRDANQAELGHGCQIVKCTCEKPHDSLLPSFSAPETAEVQWHQDGTAFCPEGMALKTEAKRSLYDRPLY
jgi:hypothetical protein